MVWILAALVLGLLVYEIVALKKNNHMTISEVVWRMTFQHPLVPFAFGLLMGHFFWQSTKCFSVLGH